MWLYLLGFIFLLCVLHLIFNCNKRARMMMKIPGPKLDFVVVNSWMIIQNEVAIIKMARELTAKYSGIFRLWMFPFGAVIIYNPEDIEKIMSNVQYSDKSLIYAILKPWLRDGLLISNGTKWQERRKILTPAFHFNILKQFFEIIEDNSQKFVEGLKKKTKEPIDVLPVLSEFTLSSICETAMGTRLEDTANNAITGKSYKAALYNLSSCFLKRFVRIYLYLDCIFYMTSFGKNQKKYLKTVHGFTQAVIEQRKECIEKNGVSNFVENDADDDTYMYKKKKKIAMLDLLISAEKEGLIDGMGIQEEVDTFMFEGHDTTASALTFCLMLLANHQNIQDKIRIELKEIFGDTKRAIKMEDLNRMKYLECCIKESLRLYPAVHFISRHLNEETILSNYKIPAGSLCHISIFDLHRRADLFKNPHNYEPDRFLPENSADRHPFAYIPFSAGHRNCIGQKFAMMEMKVVITKVLQEFDLVPVTRPEDIQFIADLVLRNNGPVHVNFIKREY